MIHQVSGESSSLFLKNEALQQAFEEQKEFQELLDRLDATLQSEKDREKERAEKRKADEEKQAKQRKINELRQRISALRTKISTVGHGSAAGKGMASELAALETELFWMMFSLG